MERRQQLEAQMGPEKWRAKKLRTIQGAVLVGVGVLLVLGSFTLAIVLAVKDAEFTKWTIGLLGTGLLSGVLVVAFGATFWSTEVVGSVLEDILPFVKRKAKDG